MPPRLSLQEHGAGVGVRLSSCNVSSTSVVGFEEGRSRCRMSGDECRVIEVEGDAPATAAQGIGGGSVGGGTSIRTVIVALL